MPELKTYDLFLSHAWRYNDDYYRLVRLLKDALFFTWRNYSVPEHDPVIDPNTTVGYGKLVSLLDKQVRPVNCVLILGGMYAAHSRWINEEITIAQSYNKPIVGIYPWGSERMPVVVQAAASRVVSWNTNSIVSAIRQTSI
jgi:hypothetical protein